MLPPVLGSSHPDILQLIHDSPPISGSSFCFKQAILTGMVYLPHTLYTARFTCATSNFQIHLPCLPFLSDSSVLSSLISSCASQASGSSPGRDTFTSWQLASTGFRKPAI